jgi:hypothetical protein
MRYSPRDIPVFCYRYCSTAWGKCARPPIPEIAKIICADSRFYF